MLEKQPNPSFQKSAFVSQFSYVVYFLRSNPYETIAKGIFQNRAAMKMANMDTVFDFMFTSPVGEDGKSLGEYIRRNNFYFNKNYYSSGDFLLQKLVLAFFL